MNQTTRKWDAAQHNESVRSSYYRAMSAARTAGIRLPSGREGRGAWDASCSAAAAKDAARAFIELAVLIEEGQR